MTGRELWPTFVEQVWERRPLRLSPEQCEALPRIEAGELFGAVVACCADFAGGGAQKVRFYVDGGEVDVRGGEHFDLLPASADGTFERYHARLAAERRTRSYALVVADWHAFDRRLWHRIVAALAPLLDRVGISAARMDTQMFLGNYAVTPFGVHVDAATAFHFPVVGTKTLRFWPGELAERTPALHRAQRYEALLDGSEAITARPGEAIYWPSSYWHVGESDGSFAVTWGTGYWRGYDAAALATEKALRVLEGLTAEVLAASRGGGAGPGAAAVEDARFLDDVVGRLGALLASDAHREALAQSWLEHYSAFGFLRVPPAGPAGAIAGATGVARRVRPFRIFSSRVSERALCVAAAGYSAIVPYHDDVVQAVRALNSDAAVALAAARGSGPAAGAIADLLELGVRAGAVELAG